MQIALEDILATYLNPPLVFGPVHSRRLGISLGLNLMPGDGKICNFELSDIEKDLIAHHMWPLTPCPPHHREAWLVCLADKMVSTRETIAGRIRQS